MGLESTMICVDTSDYMRNGDFVPTRMQAQEDAAYLVCRSKSREHPENDVGLLMMANVRVLVTLTTDVEKLLVTMNKLTPNGELDFRAALMVAQLALNHRQEKRHKMRIVAFVGSPITLTEEQLVALAKKLKKGNISVDIVSFGAEAEVANSALLTSFIDTLNGKTGGSSHLLIVTSGPFLTAALVSSPIVQGVGGSGALPGDEFEWGINEDPELALALKMSLAEQRRYDEAHAAKTHEHASPSQNEGASSGEALAGGMVRQDPSYMTEEEQIAYALKLSMAEHSSASNIRDGLPEDFVLEEQFDVDEEPEEDDDKHEENHENKKNNK